MCVCKGEEKEVKGDRESLGVENHNCFLFVCVR